MSIMSKIKELVIGDKSGLYVIKLKDKFIEQFPTNTKPYIQIDEELNNTISLIDKIYRKNDFGYKVLFKKDEARLLQKKYSQLPTTLIKVCEEGDSID